MNATTAFNNKIRMLQRTRRDTIGRRSTRLPVTCRAFPLWLKRQSSPWLLFVRFCYQFSSVICLFVRCIKVKYINFILALRLPFWVCVTFLVFKWLYWMVLCRRLWAWNGLTHKYMYRVSEKDCTFFKNSVVWWAPSWKFCAHGNGEYFNQN